MIRETVSNIISERFGSYIAYKSKNQLVIECTSTGYIFEIVRCRYDKEVKRFVHIECIDERIGLGAVMANNFILENALENSQDGLLEILHNLKNKTEITEQSKGQTIIREEYDDIDKDDWELM